jgi:MULE transposase domain/MuDR family transposase/SWIM zinc finger
MSHEVILYVRLEINESTKDGMIKMIPFEDGMSFDSFLNLIRSRFNLECDPCNLKLSFQRELRWGTNIVDINDEFDLKQFVNSVERGKNDPSIDLHIDGRDPSDDYLESQAFVGSNNVTVAGTNNVNVADTDNVNVDDVVTNGLDDLILETDAIVDEQHNMQLEPYVDPECLGMDTGSAYSADLLINDAVLVDCGLVTEEERDLQARKLKEQLSALDSCLGPDVTPEGGSDMNTPQVSVTFSDGSDLRVGKLFASKEEATNALSTIAMKGNFTYKTTKSASNILVLRCKVESCTWRIRLVKLGCSKKFEVRKYESEHTCGINGATKVQTNASYDRIASLLVSRFDSGSKGPTPKEIQSSVRHDFGCELSYWRAWRARGAALEKKRGNYELGYAVLPEYFNVLRRLNPGTVTALELKGQNFKYCFLCFGAALHGFQFVRKVIAIDGTFLTGKYGGVLLCASAQDANNHIYPLAVGVVDSENDDSWRWFLERLKECIPDNDELCFISDRNQSIWKAVAEVYKSAHHGCCTVHLWQNCKTQYRAYWLHTTFELASKAYTVQEFDVLMQTIKEGKDELHGYLTKKVGVEKWSRAHFPGNRYNLMSTNIAESFNSTMVVEKEFPIYSLLVTIQQKLCKWYYDRRTRAKANPSALTPKIEAELVPRYNASRSMAVSRLNEFEILVKGDEFQHVVNLERRHCTCRVFNIDRIPCDHAIAALKLVNDGNAMPVQIESLCHKYYTNENWLNAYEKTIYPTPPTEEWFAGVEAAEVKVLPPVKKVSRGRRESKRKPSVGEFGKPPRKRKRCTNCRKEGHYKGKCPEKSTPSTC